MTTRLTLGVLVLVALASCGDDANDAGVRARRAAVLAEEFRLQQDTDPPPAISAPDSPDAAAPGDPVQDEAATPEVTAPPIAPTGVVVPVFALDNSFRPQVLEIDVGDEVLWENRGVNEHDVLRVEGAGWGVDVLGFQPGAVYAHVFTEPGVYDYYCSIHGNETVGMVGTIVVNG